MDKISDIAAKVLSVILYPLFVPTYGMALFCYAYSLRVVALPWIWTLIAIVGTFLFTCLLPITAIWIMMRRGLVTDMQIADARQRTMPLIYTLFGFGCWCYLLIAILHAPLFWAFIAIGATCSIAIVALITPYWKISAHLIGFGGLIGGMMAYCVGVGTMFTWNTMILWLMIALLLMYARLRLHAHTPEQVCAGWLLGLICTFIPYCIYTYVA